MERDLLLLYIMAVFTGVAAIALVIQMWFLFGIFRAVRALQERANAFLDRWEPLADISQRTLEEVRKQTTEVLARLQDVAISTKNQVDKLDRITTNVSDTVRLQMERIDHTVEFALHQAREATLAVQKTVLLPVRQVRGVAAAVGAAVDHLIGRRRATVDRATLDEEMFI